jgi:hypothetical protein
MLFQKNSSVNDLLGQKETDQVYSYTKNFCKYLLKHIDFLIIHVGSNNIAIHQSVNQIISFYGDLIHYIKCKTSAQIVFTSILPRLNV